MVNEKKKIVPGEKKENQGTLLSDSCSGLKNKNKNWELSPENFKL